MMFAFTGLALAGGASAWWMGAAIVADAAIVAMSSYSAYSSGQQQRANAKAQKQQMEIQAEQYRLQAEESKKQAADEQAKAGIAQIQAEQEAMRRSSILAADIGSVYASAAGNSLLVNGGDGDTFAHILKSTVGEAEMDLSTIKDNGRMSVWERQTNARSLLVNADTSMLSRGSSLIGASMAGKNAKYYNRASYIGAGTAGISSAASAVSVGFQGASYAKGS